MNILYEQKSFPVIQNRVYNNPKEAVDCSKGDIKIIQDEYTGLIYNAEFDNSLISYDENYNNEQSYSPFFKEHLYQVANLVESVLGKQSLIEVGCGKGYFLEMLLKKGLEITGFDSTYDGKNPRVVKKNFEPGIIKERANGLILRHVLEHIPNPYDFLCKLREANGGGGLIYIEVPCVDWIIKKRAWFDIFYEHVNYFKLSDFDRMFGKIITKGHFFGNQYLYLVADLSSIRKPKFSESDMTYFPADFLKGLDHLRVAKEPVCVWGGASKGVIFSLLCQRRGLNVDMVVDVNPAKQGKFLPSTGVQVFSPEVAQTKLTRDATIYVMNSNYINEIKNLTNNIYNYIEIDT